MEHHIRGRQGKRGCYCDCSHGCALPVVIVLAGPRWFVNGRDSCVHTGDACVQRCGTSALAEPTVTVSTVVPGCIANISVSYLGNSNEAPFLGQNSALLHSGSQSGIHICRM